MNDIAREPPRDAQPFEGGGRAILVAAIAALVGLALCVLGLVVDPRQTFAAYLVAYAFAVTVLIGFLAFVMAAHAMNAGWPVAVHRIAESALGAAPALAVLVIPILFSVDALYPWAHPERIGDAHLRELVLHKRPLMNGAFFSARALGCVLLWALTAVLLRRGSLRMDEAGRDERAGLRKLSAVALPLIGITGTFAAFDWLMSLSPDFSSTMYGLYVLSGGFVAALGLLAVLMRLAQRGGFLSALRSSHWYAIGRLLFAFLLFWAYIAFFQYLLIWIANRPVEAKFYLERIRPGDRWTSWFLVWGRFAAPWTLLLLYRVRRSRTAVVALGAWIFGSHYLDVHWLVGPYRGPRAWHWQDAPALLFVGGVAVAFALWRQRGRLVSAYHDPDYARAIAYESR